MRARLTFALTAGLLLQAARATIAGTSKDIRDWYAACDNVRNCTAPR